jgi:hypothetical protein
VSEHIVDSLGAMRGCPTCRFHSSESRGHAATTNREPQEATMRLLHSLFAAGLLAFAQLGAAQSYRTSRSAHRRFPPGGGVDIVARQLRGENYRSNSASAWWSNTAPRVIAMGMSRARSRRLPADGQPGMLTANRRSSQAALRSARTSRRSRVVVTPLWRSCRRRCRQDADEFRRSHAKPGELNWLRRQQQHQPSRRRAAGSQTQMQHVPYRSAAVADLVGGRIS